MTTEKIKSAAEVISNFLVTESKNADLDANTLAVIGTLRDEGKLTKVNLLRQLEELRKSVIEPEAGSGGVDG